ncbi:response regulator [Fibrivirga algicola]|uniref:Response regulator n=1 Tax=Fibrivirga algicola TaxID=2950420 RepID=A0ABX0QES8_9BACT|nr:response regulator [Fibrivirga algicola]NID09756.1 response regulator [Fibrivirga algicola]
MLNATITTVKTILIADDDADDRLFMIEALRHNGFRHDVKFVEDGEDLMNYLTRQNGFTAENAPLPSLILLDLNMPRKNGFQALAEIRGNKGLRRLPVVVMSTSTSNGDVFKTYDIGVNSYIVKPSNFNRLVEVVSSLKYYWLETVQLPD